MCGGIAEELKGVDLGEERLNKRGKKVLEAFGAIPETSVNAACNQCGLPGVERDVGRVFVFRQCGGESRGATIAESPSHARSRLPIVTANVVLVEEVGGSGDRTDISWLLITTLLIKTLSITTLEELLLCLKHYLACWVIEIYFKMLKTGCRVEEIQLETKARLENCLALYSIIAWCVLYLTCRNRTSADLPCTAVLDDAEWKSVWCMVNKQPLPKSILGLSEMMRLVTELGGYNSRSTELPPGPQPLWFGLRRMLDFATAWLNFGPEVKKSYV